MSEKSMLSSGYLLSLLKIINHLNFKIMMELQEIKEIITSLNKEIANVKESIIAAKAVIPANCDCSPMEWMPDENQWEPSYTCEHHLALEDAEHELAACQSMLATAGKSLVSEEQCLALYDAGF